MAPATLPTGALHKTNAPPISYPSVYLDPEKLTGSFSDNPSVAVDLFGYCVDIFQYSGATTFDVQSLTSYLAPDTTKYKLLTALIAAQGINQGAAHECRGPGRHLGDHQRECGRSLQRQYDGQRPQPVLCRWGQQCSGVLSSANSYLAAAVTAANSASTLSQLTQGL